MRTIQIKEHEKKKINENLLENYLGTKTRLLRKLNGNSFRNL